MSKKIIIIGGGISGLAAAALLGKQGYIVQVFEKNEQLGGRARVWSEQGFEFDMGPSWYLMPEIFEQFAGYFNKKVSDFYELKRLDPHYRVYYEHGRRLEIGDDFHNVVAQFESIENGSGQQLNHYLALIERAYALSIKLLYLDVHQRKDWFVLENLRALVKLAQLYNPFQCWDDLVGKYFAHPDLKKILEFPSVFLGGSPYNTPALYALLSVADLKGGVWYPLGGMGKVVGMLEQLARDNKVMISTKSSVERIVVQDRKVHGVVINGETILCDAVVGTADLAHVEQELLSEPYRSYDAQYWQNKTLGISSMVLYLGLNKKLKNARHHMLYFADAWKANFDEIFVTKNLPANPSFYISVPTITDISVAPAGCDSLFVLVPIAARVYDKNELDRYSIQIIEQIESLLEESISAHCIVRRVFGPADFANDYNAFNGTALGLAHTLRQSLFGRPGSMSKKVKGLFYAGQYTNPGVGMPMALVSGELAARRVDEYFA